ncbi:uncharacterized protein LOC108095943 [Drosophila ficusphila]|uniref:uncharacterized protein LOC108095943 n=1 Tax=Drosophila ficusphila TaxID=30025 RepID=UPI0007E7D49B|nr:uncharacterized protein LOC108095943 [Drosophila ficusphila]
MAPTICSEKKQLRETRRHHGVATAAISSSTAATASSSSSSSSSTAGSTSAAAATQASSVLNFVAKGSMNSSSRRRAVRFQRKPPHVLTRGVSSSTDTSSGVETEMEMEGDSGQGMQLEGNSYSDDRIQFLPQQPHSSSDDNIKTVLQPTSASGYSSKHNRSAGAKNCDQDQVPNQVSVDDGDSGYEYSQDPVKEQHLYHQNSEGLLSIAIKTIKLVQRNKLLQKRLAQLQLETSEFIASVLANPENRHFREKISPKAEAKVSNMLLRH